MTELKDIRYFVQRAADLSTNQHSRKYAKQALLLIDAYMVKCEACGNVQKCCAPPCEKCQSMDLRQVPE